MTCTVGTVDAPGRSRTVSAAAAGQGTHVSLSGIRHGFMHGERVVRAVWDLDLEIQPGEFVCLVGPSGCGKTTLLGMVAGLVQPCEGSVTLGGKPVRSASSQTAYMLARDALLPWLTARENVELGLAVRGMGRSERRAISTEWLRRVGLDGFDDSSIRRLSQGMRQRVAIARTLAQKPTCILMDEPFAALDAQTRVLVQKEFVSLWETDRPTVVFVTHDLSEAILLGDRIILMSRRPGRIVADVPIMTPRPRDLDAPFSNDGFEAYYSGLVNRLRHEVHGIESDI